MSPPITEGERIVVRANYGGDVRRFRFWHKDAKHKEFKKLSEMIRNIYGLRKNNFVMTYADDDGDVNIAANHDVREAVNFAREADNILRIVVRDGKEHVLVPVHNVDTSSDDGDDGEARHDIHLDVVCDGCNVSPIVGTRYWCSTRPGYDLCEACIGSPRFASPSLLFRAIPYPWLLEDHKRSVPHPDLKRGDFGAEVLFLQKLLRNLGYMSKMVCSCDIGYFSDCTEQGLKSFLDHYGIYSGSRGAIYNARAAQKLASVVKESRYV